MKAQDLKGHVFGRLTVKEKAEPYVSPKGSKKTRWICSCECGGSTIVTSADLKRGDVVSCGCYKTERTIARMQTHGESNTKLHKIWKAMRKRCNNKNTSDYKYYGGKGVSVCNEWNDFMTFKEWSNNNGYKDGLTIDRIDPNGDYSPSNCRWISHKAQCNNRTTTRLYNYNNETLSIAQLSEKYGVNYSTLYARLSRGLSVADAISL